LVIDPSFRGSATAEALLQAAELCGFRVRWNAGSQLAADEIPLEEPLLPEPRRWAAFCAGGRAAALASSVVDRFAPDAGHLNAAALGAAAASVVREPQAWESWPDSEDALTRLKDLWHILVVYGHPAVA
jgi:hypothetical protein